MAGGRGVLLPPPPHPHPQLTLHPPPPPTPCLPPSGVKDQAFSKVAMLTSSSKDLNSSIVPAVSHDTMVNNAKAAQARARVCMSACV